MCGSCRGTNAQLVYEIGIAKKSIGEVKKRIDTLFIQSSSYWNGEAHDSFMEQQKKVSSVLDNLIDEFDDSWRSTIKVGNACAEALSERSRLEYEEKMKEKEKQKK